MVSAGGRMTQAQPVQVFFSKHEGITRNQSMPASAKGITKKGTKCDVGPKKKAGPRAVKRVNKKTTKHTALKRTPTVCAAECE